jgi:hypothetical protein
MTEEAKEEFLLAPKERGGNSKKLDQFAGTYLMNILIERRLSCLSDLALIFAKEYFEDTRDAPHQLLHDP